MYSMYILVIIVYRKDTSASWSDYIIIMLFIGHWKHWLLDSLFMKFKVI